MSHIATTEEQRHDKATNYSVLDVESDEANSASLKLWAPRKWPATPRPVCKSGFGVLGELALLTLPLAFLGSLPINYKLDLKAE